MSEVSSKSSGDTAALRGDGTLGRWMSLGFAALFVMVILSVFGVMWKAKHSRQQAERFNRLGAPLDEREPAIPPGR